MANGNFLKKSQAMHDFHYKGDELFCEKISIQHIVEQVGTPCYIYSHRTLIRHFHAFDDAFQDIPHIVAYAMKANSNIAVLRLLAKEGSGADIVSGGLTEADFKQYNVNVVKK